MLRIFILGSPTIDGFLELGLLFGLADFHLLLHSKESRVNGGRVLLLQSFTLTHGHLHLKISHRGSLHLARHKVCGRCIESAHGCRIAKLKWTHLNLLLLMQFSLLLELFCIKHSLAFGHLFGLPLVPVLDIVDFVFEHLFSRFFRFLSFEVEHGHSHLIAVLFGQVGLDYFDLFALGVFNFAENAVQILSRCMAADSTGGNDCLGHLTVTCKAFALLVSRTVSKINRRL